MSSSFHSTGETPTQRVPAWKRLGLKLKPASEAQGHDATLPAGAPPSVPNSQAHLGGSTPNAKRKASAGAAPALDHSAKRPRQQDTWQGQNTASSHQTPRKAKSVSFTPDTTGGKPPAAAKPKSKKQKTTSSANDDAAATAAPAKPIIKRSAPVNLEPALAYLRTWHTARENWKFNKNHQTKLLEQVFAGADETTIPAADIGIFYEYIRGLQGGVRARLRALANGIKTQDMEQGATAKTEMAERKQKEYEEVIRAFLGQPRTAGKRRFNEVDYVLRTTDMEMQRRVVKRMRAEMVLDELSETDESETTVTTSASDGSGSGSTSTEKGDAIDSARARSDVDEEARLSLNDGPPQRVKRRRKLRTAAVEDTSSSESESDSDSESESESKAGNKSDSDTSSSGSDSSSDESDDDEEPTRRDDETSSSSSSSSSESDSSDESDED
ncbi:hypothetical protein GGS20DRAFT_555811 [Poronia punctata]|nr:hypothetical protein GGS20DRAFT_555811 [Poronia punctata]